MKASIFLLATLLLVFACSRTDLSSSQTLSMIKNLSNHEITISVFRSGISQESLNRTIPVDTNKQVLDAHGQGKGTIGIYADALFNTDSVIVQFGKNVTAIHYSQNSGGSNRKAVLRSNPRNLYNKQGYVREVLEERKHYLKDQFTYTFTQQDYLDAQK